MASDDQMLQTITEWADLGNGQVAEYAIVVVSYMSSEADGRYAYKVIGDPFASTVIGHMEMVKHDLIVEQEL